MIVDLNLKNKLVIIIGCGHESLKKIEALCHQHCKILLICDKMNEKFLHVINKNNNITIRHMRFNADNINAIMSYNPFLVMAATNDKCLNKKIIDITRKMRCYSYAVDDPVNSDFAHPAIINFNNIIHISISTSGKSPLVSKQIKLTTQKIFSKIIKNDDVYKIKLQQIVRSASKKIFKSQLQRKKLLYQIWNDVKISKLIEDGKFNEAKNTTIKILNDLK